MEYKIKQWIKDNPIDADCREDLCNWACEEFEIDDDKTVKEVWDYAKQTSHLPK